jgi:hypothetical protein
MTVLLHLVSVHFSARSSLPHAGGHFSIGERQDRRHLQGACQEGARH